MLKQAVFFRLPFLLVSLFLISGIMATRVWAAAPPPPIDYGNGWVDLNKPWIKLRVWENGIYRVTGAQLAAAGLDTNTVNPGNLHLIYRGQEQHIFVSPSSTGNLDFMEFYGLRNDGRVDSTMYKNPATGIHDGNQLPNIRLSLFSDTTAYFLTWDNVPGLRYSSFFDNSYSSYTPQPSYRVESFYEFHPNDYDRYNKGGGAQYDRSHNLNSYYITGEGYAGKTYYYGAQRTIFLNTPQAANAGNPSDIWFRVYGQSSWTHITEVKVVNTIMFRDTSVGVNIRTKNFPYAPNLAATTRLQFYAWGPDYNNTDYNTLCWASIFYDRKCNLVGDGLTWIEKWSSPSNSYFRFYNTNIGGAGWVWDPITHTRIEGSASGDTLKAILPGNSGPTQYCVVTDSSLKSALVEPVTFAGLSATNNVGDFLIISHRSLTNSANAYKQYRDTCTVNGFQAKVVFVDEIYDEFGYGTITPLAIKRFCKYAIENWATPPKYVFLWGKGQYETRNHPGNLVPAYGYPASDYEYISDYDPFVPNIVPVVPIGRVNVFNDTEGFVYLNKINQYEHTPWDPWMKRSVFLGGGENVVEQGAILNYLQRYRAAIEKAPNGGLGYYWQKYNTGISSNGGQFSGPTEVIDKGTGIIHFFGHSTSNIYDVDIQEPYLYQNFGKYPLMLAFGCYGGDFTGGGKSFGERFMVEKDRGSIGYIANSTAGFLSPLGEFGDIFYPVAFDSLFGKPIGDIMAESIRQFWARSHSQDNLNHGKQVNLQGDPSLVLYHAGKPDLAVSQDEVWLSPTGYSSGDSVYTLNVVIRNLAIVAQDSFKLSVRQLTPQGNWIVHSDTLLAPVLNADTIQLTIKNTLGRLIAGQNIFDIFADSTNIINELSESNNRLNWQVVIPGDIPGILFPYDFAVIDSNTVKLAASSLFVTNQQNVRYIYEIDTDIDFNTPNLINSGVVVGSAVYSEWQVPITLKDSAVYYWRVRFADVLPAIWAQASFKYIAGKRGWAQSDPPQFFKDVSTGVTMDKIDREWEFNPRHVNIHAWVHPGQNAFFRLDEGAYRNVDVSGTLWGVMYNSIDPITLTPGPVGTVNGDWRYVPMPAAQNDLIAAINAAPVGNYFLICAQQNAQPQLWSGQMRAALYNIGVDTTRFRSLNDFDPFIILGRKGAIGQATQIYEPNIVDTANNINVLDLRQVLSSTQFKGDITSTRIGPSVEWKELIWNWKSLDQFPAENTEVTLKAIRNNNTDTLIYQGIPRGSYPLTGVDAALYPYMRLSARVADSIKLTAPQLVHWHILNEATPDAAIDPVTYFNFDKDTVYEGQTITLALGARNVSGTDMDSLLVDFRIIRPGLNPITLPSKRYAKLPAKQRIDINYAFGTGGLDLEGDLIFQIEINPANDQPELNHWNNIYTHSFYVIPDKINPLLDVTFDGKHLMDGDIVSPKPEILVEINDENEFLAVSDTAFEVYFGPRSLTGSGMQRIFIDGNPNMQKVPATLPENKAKLYFRPDRLADGEYTLRVQGYDQNRNASGPIQYEINFEVVNKNAISEVLNYPNPFSTSTRFVYTLTGDQLPERFEIQIFTITGKLVKVIDLAEMGDIQYGRNISKYAWDGMDEYGDMLANGVYVYKVVTKLNGKTLDNRDEGISEFFNGGGYGKMYIMR